MSTLKAGHIPKCFDDTNDLVAFLECAFALVPEHLERMGIREVANLRSRANNPEIREDGDLACSRCFCKYGVAPCWWPADSDA